MRTIFETSYQYQGLLTAEGNLVEANAISLQGIDSKLSDVVGQAVLGDTLVFGNSRNA